MTFNGHIESFAGLPVVDFDPGAVSEVSDPAAVAWRVAVEYEDEAEVFLAALDALIGAVGPSVTALIIGEWGTAYEEPPPIDALVERAGALPNLRALFLGEMTFEECEVSWITVGDPSKLLAAWPGLAHLWCRGSHEFTPVTSPVLE